ncbi:CPBP family intramembrane glutamic endopeptidase [Parvicella tangerina]|nr:CPBP family intramembrane glutamic endopeptidase [Parvicella tangerina]
MNPVLEKYGQVVKSLNLSWVVIVFLSFSAGVGEEFFFRGVLQDYLGIVITAIIFVLIHGYLNPFDKIIFVYGLMMTVIIIGVGFIDKYIGLTSAMVAHMVIDVILFYKLSNTDLLQDPFFIKQDADFSENNQ